MELLERDAPLKSLGASLREARGGVGRIALVCGEAGIGKTALVEGFLAAHQAEARLLLGRCDALFTPQPLAPLHDVALQTKGALLQLIQTAGARLAIFSAMVRELQEGERPTVLVFEDVHWADAATLDLIKYLGRRIRAAPTLIILTYRGDELDGGHPLWSVLGNLPADAIRRVPVAPLTEAAVARLARHAGRSAAGVHAQTGGNPFYVTELLASPPGSVPATVREATRARAVRLSPGARAVLELCSVVPSRIERWLVEEPEAAFAAFVDECIATGLIVDQGDVLAFRHELARQAVESGLSPQRRRALHETVLRRLLESGGRSITTARLVHHATGAGDAAAVRAHAPQAAREAAALGAHREAAVHYRTALEHTAADELELRAILSEGYGYECSLIDRIDDAIVARQTALALRQRQGDLVKAGDNLRWLSRLAWFHGRGEEARALAVQVVQMLEPLAPGAELAMAYSNTAQLYMLSEDGPEAVLWGERALRLAEPLGLTEIQIHALNNIGTAEFRMGNPAGLAKLERSLELALTHGFQEHAARAYTNLSYMALTNRGYACAEKWFIDGLAYTRERDLDAWTLYMQAARSRAHLERGMWQQAEDDASAVLATARAGVTRVMALIVLGCVRLRRGEPGAEPLLDEARELALVAGDLQRIGPMAAARAEAAWLKGDRGQMRAEVEAACELALRHPGPWRLGELALWLWRAGVLESAPEGAALPYRLEIGGDWQRAAAAWEKIGCPYEQALALAQGDRPAQLQALEILVKLGAAAAAAIVRRDLRAAGLHGIPRGPRAATKGNPLGLTARQLDILRLLAGDLANKEIAAQLRISPKTVDHHVSAVLAKLGVATRRQAGRHPITRALLAQSRESAGET